MDFIIENVKQIIDGIRAWADNVVSGIGEYLSNPIEFVEFYTFVVRWLFPILAVLVLLRCILPLLQNGGSNRIWGFLEIKDSYRIPIMHWENSIGRSKLSDIVINLPFISRSHAVLSFGENGWTITDLASKGGVRINGEKVDNSGSVEIGDTISFATAEFQFIPGEEEFENRKRKSKLDWLSKLGQNITSGKTFLLILAFQFLGGVQIYLSIGEEANIRVLYIFMIFMTAESIHYFILSKFSRKYRELELLIYFLCGLNLFVVAVAAPGGLTKQLVAIILGIIIYAAIQLIIKDVGRGRKLKYILVGCSIVLMILNLTIGEARFGARNWINLGFITFQPMEFVKVAFILAGTATLDKLLTTRNLTAFIGFSGTCIGALILMRDLGTSVIFFVTFLVVAFMRSGDIRTIAFISAGAALGAFAVVSFLPYIAARFEAWGHVWEFADTIGYQQTRTMIASASGGLLGVGGGNGYLVGVAASDTDLVFGILCEEWGLIVALCAVLMIVFLAFFVLFLMRGCKSSFYAISACGAVSIFMIQSALNIFGSLDLLPLTGVTLPFVSNGGSSMVVCWALLAFIKAADERIRPDLEYNGTDRGEIEEGVGEA
ncbi:MAG TPA: FtsW/RodA/SpoVE family cell cycle protein [Anaerovoracaceae bacterium]|nr:FtsW/RodA/SpoVE family cell cycle protein [Anaerovoracaceae bacterium]